MTFLRKSLAGEIEISPADQVFENTILKTIGNPKLTAIQKAGQLRYLKQLAETPYQREVADAYSLFAESMLVKDGIDESAELATRIEKARTMALSALALLNEAERKRSR